MLKLIKQFFSLFKNKSISNPHLPFMPTSAQEDPRVHESIKRTRTAFKQQEQQMNDQLMPPAGQLQGAPPAGAPQNAAPMGQPPQGMGASQAPAQDSSALDQQIAALQKQIADLQAQKK